MNASVQLISGANRQHLLRETAVSMLINAILSALFVWLVFGGRSQVPVWGFGGLALDSVPQTFVITLMATLVPSAITRKKLRNGKLHRTAAGGRKLPRNLLLRALFFAVVVTTVAVGATALLLSLLAADTMSLASVAILKVAYGALLALVVTSFAIRRELAGE